MMPDKTPRSFAATTPQARSYCGPSAAMIIGAGILAATAASACALWRWLPQIFAVIMACVVIRSGFVLADGLPAVLAQAAAMHEWTAP